MKNLPNVLLAVMSTIIIVGFFLGMWYLSVLAVSYPIINVVVSWIWGVVCVSGIFYASYLVIDAWKM